jgi:hypothetical protein
MRSDLYLLFDTKLIVACTNYCHRPATFIL